MAKAMHKPLNYFPGGGFFCQHQRARSVIQLAAHSLKSCIRYAGDSHFR